MKIDNLIEFSTKCLMVLGTGIILIFFWAQMVLPSQLRGGIITNLNNISASQHRLSDKNQEIFSEMAAFKEEINNKLIKIENYKNLISNQGEKIVPKKKKRSSPNRE